FCGTPHLSWNHAAAVCLTSGLCRKVTYAYGFIASSQHFTWSFAVNQPGSLRCRAGVLLSAGSADVHIDGGRDAVDAARTGVLPDVVMVVKVQRVAVLGDPDIVLADVGKVEGVVEPACVGVDARLVARVADGLAEGDGAGRALAGADGVGAAAGDGLGVIVDAQRQRIPADQAEDHAGFLDSFGFVDGLAVEVDADAQARVDGALDVLAEGRI